MFKMYLVMAAFNDGTYKVIESLSAASEAEALELAIIRNGKNVWVELDN